MVQLNLDLFFRNNEYGQWPASGEIDILESRGKLNIVLSLLHIIKSFIAKLADF